MTTHPALKQLTINTEDAARAIHNLAMESSRAAIRRRRGVLVTLDSCVSPPLEDAKVDVSPSYDDLKTAIEPAPEYGKEIESLHQILYTSCFCVQKGASGAPVARLRLQGGLRSSSKGVTFGILFSSHPHHDIPEESPYQGGPQWQDTHISVPKLRAVKFGPEDQHDTTGSEEDLLSSEDFCAYISEPLDSDGDYAILLFSANLNRGKLVFEDSDTSSPRELGFKRPSISLGQLLKVTPAVDLKGKKKEVLSWLLAKAVWQYYSSPWMLEPWSKERVHFIFERRRTDRGEQHAGFFPDEPLLSISITPSAGKNDNEARKKSSKSTDAGSSGRKRPKIDRSSHRIPKILSLGVMLVEIQLGRPIESLYREPRWQMHCNADGTPSRNINHKICKDLIKVDRILRDVADPLEALIDSCIQPRKAFLPPVAEDEKGVRSALYTLVHALEVYPPTHHPVAAALHPRTLKWLTKHPAVCSTQSTSTQAWLRRMDTVKFILRGAADDSFANAKIAVLDTGVSPDDAASEYLSGYHDLVNRGSGPMDKTGHGTSSANLVMDMCPSAEVYAIRVFEHDSANDKTLSLALEAITWCVDNEIDIVCMAFGFTDHNNELYTAIHAASLKMLIFAASTNDGNASKIHYPAQYDDSVICMFSTNGAVKGSWFNHSIGLPGTDNFAILGQDIETSSSNSAAAAKSVEPEQKYGTSFSTAIAAGVAGLLLEFSRHRDTRAYFENPLVPGLRGKWGMAKVLRRISVKDSSFHCIQPWGLLPDSLQQVPPPEGFIIQPEQVQAARKVARRTMIEGLVFRG
ncbi:hypothetical protein B0T19DRAFT_451323 [Cercophora scortea]|uniref:Peptidase S8/S53 domain-containing protein n=1 Tax=Cercophora scortea TaxID=314031 RepID=A0AAE0I7C3_9PEZI|nr:hypothetical protein B0T19DRAFT_451323 [Cercophora scortea]